MEILIIKNNRTVLNWEYKSPFAKYQLPIEDIDKVEKFATNIIKNDRLKKFVVTLLGCGLYTKQVLAAGKGIDGLGWTILGLIRHWAYWILLIYCIVEIIRAGLSGDSKKTFPIIMKFLIIFASMYLVPELFNAIKDSF